MLTNLNGFAQANIYKNQPGEDFKISLSELLMRVKGSRRHGKRWDFRNMPNMATKQIA